MTMEGYIALQFDDGHRNVKFEVFDRYPYKFTCMIVSGVISTKFQRYLHDYIGAENKWYYWATLFEHELQSMNASGRVDLQNHSVVHHNCLFFNTVHMAEDELKREIFPCNDFIEGITGRKPIAFVAPFNAHDAWIEGKLDGYFKYWLDTMWDMNNWLSGLNDIPVPQHLKTIYLNDKRLIDYGWTYIDELLTYLKTNKKLAILHMHGITWENIAIKDVNFSPANFKVLADKLKPMHDAGHLILFREIPELT